MPTKETLYDFWRVSVPTTYSGGFKNALTQLSQATPISSRNEEIDGDIVRWEQLDLSDPRYIYGDFGKLRMLVLPKKGGINQLSSPLPFSSTEGVDELFAFMYDENSKILVTQYNHYGSSLRTFQKYMLSKINFGGPIHLFPILSQNGAQKLRDMQEIRKLTYKVARPTTQSLNPLAQSGFDTAISQLDSFGAQTVECTISMDRRRSSLVATSVRSLFGLLSGTTNSDVMLEKFEVTGYLNGEKEHFDLIKDRMRHTESLQISTDRSISFGSRKAAARRAFDTMRGELIAQFGTCCR